MSRRWTLRLALLITAISLSAGTHAAGERAAEARELATRLANAEGVPRDLPRAYRLYCMAALSGDAEAMYHLGRMYLDGRGVAHDDALAKDWLQRADRHGDVFAKRLLKLLPTTPARIDPVCVPNNGKAPTRRQVTAWVKLLAPEYELDPSLVLSVIAAESNFNARALSHRNAHGLMQLIPRTAQRFQVADIWHPIDNLHGGMAYLSWLMDAFDQDVALSLAAYNAGELAVRRYGGIPPYPETRAYVKRILASYQRTPPR